MSGCFLIESSIPVSFTRVFGTMALTRHVAYVSADSEVYSEVVTQHDDAV